LCGIKVFLFLRFYFPARAIFPREARKNGAADKRAAASLYTLMLKRRMLF